MPLPLSFLPTQMKLAFPIWSLIPIVLPVTTTKDHSFKYSWEMQCVWHSALLALKAINATEEMSSHEDAWKICKKRGFCLYMFSWYLPNSKFMDASRDVGDSFNFCMGCSTNPTQNWSYQESNNLDKSFECITWKIYNIIYKVRKSQQLPSFLTTCRSRLPS